MPVDPTKTGGVTTTPSSGSPPVTPPPDRTPPSQGSDTGSSQETPPPPEDLATYYEQALQDAAAAAEFAKNPQAMQMVLQQARANTEMISREGMREAEINFTNTVEEHQQAQQKSADVFNNLTHEDHARGMDSARLFEGLRKGDAGALAQLNKLMAHFGIGTGKPSANAEKNVASQLMPGASMSGSPAGKPAGNTAGKAATAGAPRDPNQAAMPRQLTAAQRQYLAQALRQKMESGAEGMTEEMRENMKLWAEALEGKEEIPEELALAMIRPEESDEEERLTREQKVEGESDGESSDKPEKTPRDTSKKEAPRSRTELAVAYLASHPPSARGSGGGALNREEREELEARIAGGIVSFLGGAEGEQAAQAQGQVYGLRALLASGEYYIGVRGVAARGQGGHAGELVGFGEMADPQGVAVREKAGLDESIAHGETITLNSGRTLNLWQAGYGEGAETRLGALCRDYLSIRTMARAKGMSGAEVAFTGQLHAGMAV